MRLAATQVQQGQQRQCNKCKDASVTMHDDDEHDNKTTFNEVVQATSWLGRRQRVDYSKYDSRTTGNDEKNGNNIMNANDLRLRCDWVDASLQCWRQRGCTKIDDASKTRAKTPAWQRQQRQRNAGNNNNAMLPMMPATCGQGRQCNIGKNASAASARPSKAKSQWSDAGDGNKAIGNGKETATTPHTPTCCNCGGTGQTPV
jgi:hypothetical protein